MQRLEPYDALWVPIEGGKIYTVDFMIFDAGDPTVDSVLILDELSF